MPGSTGQAPRTPPPPLPEQWRRTEGPQGYPDEIRLDTARAGGDTFYSGPDRDWLGDAFEALRVWAEAVGGALLPGRRHAMYSYINGQALDAVSLSVVSTFTHRNAADLADMPEADARYYREERFRFTPTPCVCGTEVVYGRATCPYCEGVMSCGGCGHRGTQARYVEGEWACTACAHVCSAEGCTSMSRMYTTCEEHGNRFYCAGCDRTRDGDSTTVGEYEYCERCVEGLCSGCDRVFREEEVMVGDEGEVLCQGCHRKGLGSETEDENDIMQGTKLRLPTIPGREAIRTCGVEIEGANGSSGRAGNLIAYKLYQAQVSMYDSMRSYHGGGIGSFAHVERDSSVDWECVIGPLNMAVVEDVRKLNKTVRVLRDTVRAGEAALDMRCGLHIHVSAEGVGLAQAYNLHTLFAFLEDPFYRIGAARWAMHRSIALNDQHYCKIGPRQSGKVQFARIYNDDRYFGLSFANYFKRMLEGCECGAGRYGVFEECTCSLRKCTFEFRLFNTTTNTRKLHAYLALTQALVAKAISMPEINDAADYPELTFVQERFSSMNEDRQQEMLGKWDARLRWMGEHLPLTPAERESVRYCLDHSELSKLGADVLDVSFPSNQEVAV